MSNKKVSRQREWQRKQVKLGNCPHCGAPADEGRYCAAYMLMQRTWMRNRYRKKHGIPLDAPLHSIRQIK